MRTVHLSHDADFSGWRRAAAKAWTDGLCAGDVLWSVPGETEIDLFSGMADDGGGNEACACRVAGPPLFAERTGALSPHRSPLKVPRSFLPLAQLVVCHSDPERFALLYGLLSRLQQDRHLLRKAADPLVKRIGDMAKAVRRDAHKMTAFVRFRKVGGGDAAGEREQFVSWFEPTHHIVRHVAPFFVRRFAAMDWCILTADVCVAWDGTALKYSEGVSRPAVLDEDELEDVWRRYYASIFNPARLKVSAMQSEMPKKYWKNLPEAQLIPELVRSAHARERSMTQREGTTPNPRMMMHKAPVQDEEERG